MIQRSTRTCRAAAWRALAFLLIAISSKAEIDLTPSVGEYTSEGIKYQRLMFRDEKQLVAYYPPPGWTFSGGVRQVQLTPPKKSFAQAVIEAVPLDKPHPLDQKAVDAFRQRLMAELPSGSQFAKIEQETENSVPVNGGPSFEVVISYQAMGQKFVRSAVLANVRETQLVFLLTASKDDFEALHRDFKASIFSWHWLEPEPENASSETGAKNSNLGALDSASR
jgi:hypothetical protein